jgi:hypothetical protein
MDCWARSPHGEYSAGGGEGRRAIDRMHAWMNASKKLVWLTKHRMRVIAVRLTFASMVVIVHRLLTQVLIDRQ